MFVLFEIFWKLGYNLIKNYKFLEIKRLSSENGSFSCEVPFWILDRFHYIVVALYVSPSCFLLTLSWYITKCNLLADQMDILLLVILNMRMISLVWIIPKAIKFSWKKICLLETLWNWKIEMLVIYSRNYCLWVDVKSKYQLTCNGSINGCCFHSELSLSWIISSCQIVCFVFQTASCFVCAIFLSFCISRYLKW